MGLNSYQVTFESCGDHYQIYGRDIQDVMGSVTGRATACGCGTDCYSHWSVQAESIMSVIKRSDNGKSAEAYDIDELKNNWNHWVRTGEILFTPGNGRW